MDEIDSVAHEHTDSWKGRVAVLANGEAVPLVEAQYRFGLLQILICRDDLEWDGLYFLRETCLGRPIEPEQRDVLMREKLLQPDGLPDPVMRAVVLASVRGCDRQLYLDSPFTDNLDKAMSEYIHARHLIRSELNPRAAEAFLRDDPAQNVIDLLREANRAANKKRDFKSYADEIIRRAKERESRSPNDSSPPPPPPG